MKEDFGKYKALYLFNTLALSLQNVQMEKDTDLGEPGLVKVVTHIKGQNEVDSSRAGCLLRSRWINADRIVENKNTELQVTDLILTKRRIIERSEASGDVFEAVMSNLSDCAQNSALVLQFNDSIKTAEMKEEDKLKGPPLEKMTDTDADKLKDVSGPRSCATMDDSQWVTTWENSFRNIATLAFNSIICSRKHRASRRSRTRPNFAT